MAIVYVLSKDGKPLDPTVRCGHVRILLKQKKARVVETKPFTIQLKYEVEHPDQTQRYILGIDPGRTNIGMDVVTVGAESVYSAGLTTNNKDVPKHMAKRKQHRQASRQGERKRRRRRAKAHHTDFPYKQKPAGEKKTENIRDRILPGCEEPIRNHDIINTEARFNNRRRPEGWLTPTANHLCLCHVNAVKKIQKILPVSDVVLELNKFAFMKMDNPNIRPWEYQNGPLKGFKNVDDAVCALQEGHCIFCEKEIAHYHHIVPRSKGGSDTLENKAGVCKEHHDLIHTDKEWVKKMVDLKQGMNKKYHALSVLNQIMPSLLKELDQLFPGHVHVTTGRSTKAFRDKFNISKDHYLDAYCIACSILDPQIAYPPENHFELHKFRRHDRAVINHQAERTYKLDGKIVAKNRKPRFEQKGSSLKAFLETFPEEERRKICSRLSVKRSTRSYNDPNRILPGNLFFCDGKRYVLSGQLSHGQYLRAFGDKETNFPARECKLVSSGGWMYL